MGSLQPHFAFPPCSGGDSGVGKGVKNPPPAHSSFPPRFCSNPRWRPGLGKGGSGCTQHLWECSWARSPSIPKAPRCLGSPGAPPRAGDSSWGPHNWLGTPQLAGDISEDAPCSSLQAEASISWPSPEQQTGDKEGWDQGHRRSPPDPKPCCSSLTTKLPFTHCKFTERPRTELDFLNLSLLISSLRA